MADSSRICYLALFLFFNLAWTTEYKPWFGDQLEYELRSNLIYQHYSSLTSGSRTHHYPSDDLFFNLSLANSPYPEIDIEAEVMLAKTRHKSNFVDSVRLTGRYLWLDDVAGDPLSLTTGITLTNAFKGGLQDVSSFHHGLVEAEFHTAIGKEYSSCEVWDNRFWLVGAVGIADRGSPWMRGDFEYDLRVVPTGEIKGFVHTLWGFGGQNLHLHHFNGYGPINHQSADFGLKYTHLLEFFGHLSLEYTYRAYARNFPSRAQRVALELLYEFPP